MAVDIEKVAMLLTSAYNRIDELEAELEQYKAGGGNLSKEASKKQNSDAIFWEDVTLGSVADISNQTETGEARLNRFLGLE